LCNSTLIAPIPLANLLSADLWLLSEKIRSKYSPSKGTLETAPALIPAVAVGEEGLSRVLSEIQRQVDRGFKHVHPNEIADIYGYLDIQTERRRLGHEQVNDTLGKIQRALEDRAALGEQQNALTTLILNDISHERFPAYIYQNYDLVHAHRKFRGHGSRAPDGLLVWS
jgi:hypothetical protein